jgi:hypothetical protein
VGARASAPIDLDVVIESVLGSRDGPSRWRVSFGAVRGAVVLEDEWITLDAPWRGQRKLVPFGLLERNAALHGNAKHLMLESGAIRLRAEIPLRGVPLFRGTGLAESMREAAASVTRAAGRSVPLSPTVCRPSETAAHVDGARFALAGLCEESGWPYTERKGGRMVVNLDVQGSAFFQASVARRASGGIRLGVELARVDAMLVAEPPLLAASALLLHVGALVRMARPVAQRNEGRVVMGLEVDLAPTPSCAEFVHALSALSVASGQCGREVEALLEDEMLARAYLETRHAGRHWVQNGLEKRRRAG